MWLSIRWEPSPSWDSSALHGALLRELGAQGERANEAERAKYRRPLRLRSFANANERFMRCMIYVYRAQERLDSLLSWERPQTSALVLLLWACACVCFDLWPLLLPLLLAVASFRADAVAAEAAPPPPLSHDTFSLAEKAEFLYRLQNFQLQFADRADAIHRFWVYDLCQPRLLSTIQLTSALLVAPGYLLAVGTGYPADELREALSRLLEYAPPMYACALVTGAAPLLLGNPRVRALVALFKFHVAVALRKRKTRVCGPTTPVRRKRASQELRALSMPNLNASARF